MAKAAEVAIEQMDTPTEELAPVKTNRRKLIIMVIAIVAGLAAAGGGAWYFLGHSADDEGDDAPAPVAAKGKAAAKSAEKDKAPVKDKKPSIFMNLETFTVNLQSDGTDHILQTTIVFDVSDKVVAEAIQAQMPAIRSKLLLLLSSKTTADINTPKGKERLAEEIVTEARKHFHVKGQETGLTQVLFNSFVIQ
jgi:flagellar FliL protein